MTVLSLSAGYQMSVPCSNCQAVASAASGNSEGKILRTRGPSSCSGLAGQFPNLGVSGHEQQGSWLVSEGGRLAP